MFDYAPGTQERKNIDEAIKKREGEIKDIPIVIGDEEIRTNDVKYQVCVCISRTVLHIEANNESVRG